jgi:hypothetical protein
MVVLQGVERLADVPIQARAAGGKRSHGGGEIAVVHPSLQDIRPECPDQAVVAGNGSPYGRSHLQIKGGDPDTGIAQHVSVKPNASQGNDMRTGSKLVKGRYDIEQHAFGTARMQAGNNMQDFHAP